MAQKKIKAPQRVVERNLFLVGQIMKYLMNNPQVFASLPDHFELVVLPENDPEMRVYNLELLDKYGSEGKPIVFARVRALEGQDSISVKPSLFVPIPAAA
ncbi:MAG: DUF5647 family protein [Thermodesulfobacteriota bacterium]